MKLKIKIKIKIKETDVLSFAALLVVKYLPATCTASWVSITTQKPHSIEPHTLIKTAGGFACDHLQAFGVSNVAEAIGNPTTGNKF